MESVFIMPKFVDLKGKQFGRLTVISQAGKNKNGHILWNCLCECGKEKICYGTNLKTGKSLSCRCLAVEKTIERTLKHGNRRGNGKTTREYETWCSMIGRCETETDTNFHNYGARGIKVCERWRHSFEIFLEDMGKRPSPKHSIDRIDVNGNYEPSNCQWATREEQIHNRRLLKTNKTGVNGVYFNKQMNKYHAQIYTNGKKKHLGFFDTLEEAKESRKIAEKQFWKTS